jgi:delta 1-pyrroline-5-carboxylate dehydrogenase
MLPMMWKIDKAYIDGAFVPLQGSKVIESVNPATEQVIGMATLASREDAKRAIAAAKRTQEGLNRSSKAERFDMLRRMHCCAGACGANPRYHDRRIWWTYGTRSVD